MRRILILLLWVVAFPSCEEQVPEVSFRIKTSGFYLEEARDNNGSSFPSFIHRISGGYVSFTGNGHVYDFDLQETSLTNFEFMMPAGDYLMEIRIPPASLYGQDAASYIADPLRVTVPPVPDTVNVHLEANCSLILVKDKYNQLEEGIFMIHRHLQSGYIRYYPLERDTLSGLYFTYFTPDTVPSAPSVFLWLYGRNAENREGGLSTAGLEPGFQYLIEILD